MTPAHPNLPSPPESLLQGASLFLDFDGTLVEIASRPDVVRVGERLHRLMSALGSKLAGRLAIVSGRPAADVRALFGDLALAIGGSHGVELHWPDGRTESPRPLASIDRVRAELAEFERAHPGVVVEFKPFGVALHYRLAPHAEHDCLFLASRLADREGYSVQIGKMVVELKAATGDKGGAVLSFMQLGPMAQGRPVFVGDDDTDEAAFRQVSELGGAGVLVGPPRPTFASYRIANVNQTLQWLESASERI